MKEVDEFQKIGKKLPYQMPGNFFELVSEKTLRKAKQREQNRRKSLMLRRIVTVAASLSALALLGYFMLEPNRPETNLIVQEKQTVTKPIIEQKQEVPEQPTEAEIRKTVPEKTLAKEKIVEKISDVISEMSDDELLQLAAMYKSDPFIGESAQ